MRLRDWKVSMILNNYHIVKNKGIEVFSMATYSPIVINKFEGFQDINVEVLSLIDKDENGVYNGDDNSETAITKTDYFSNTQNSRAWLKFLKPYLIKNIDMLCGAMNYNAFMIGAAWYQQYENSSSHGWHGHSSNYSGVFYVEMPEDAPRTEFYDPKSETTYFLPMNEGDIALFPAYLPHRSTPNNSSKRKTIISFNLDLNLYPGS